SAGAFGVAAFSAGAAHAVTDSCTPACPVIAVDDMAANGSVRVTYTDPVAGAESVDPNSVALTVIWKPQGDVPGTAPSPNPTTIRLTNANGMCTGTGPVTCDYPFPSALKVGGFALNGTYQLSASARDCGLLHLPPCSTTTTPTKSTTLTTPASTPGGVKADLLPDKSGVKISWAANPEPDVFAYRVLRNDGSEACNNLLTPADLSCSDTSSGGGTFSYRVIAIRYGADYNPKSQVTSAPSTATKSVVVPGPPATTTTTITGGTLPPLTQPPFPGKPGAPKPVPGAGGTGTFNARPGTPAAAVAGSDTPANGDTGFAPTLPYGEQPSTTVNEDPGSIAAGPVTAHKGKTSVGTIAVVGAGLLIAVIALHGLWLRSEVRRSGTLEALEPEA
ncbi:MAG: hypothetical protein QOK20_689, partial [Acidimicrobiaceae bacterium]|nr:hypothetical protein [Acidimicrobiaceae bacterium]